MLSFLQELLEKGHSPSMLKVYVAAIAASHTPIDGQSVGRNNFCRNNKRALFLSRYSLLTFVPWR